MTIELIAWWHDPRTNLTAYTDPKKCNADNFCFGQNVWQPDFSFPEALTLTPSQAPCRAALALSLSGVR
jgi:hypothetical protein